MRVSLLSLVMSNPDPGSGLEPQRVEIQAAFHEQWVPLPGSEPKLLTGSEYAEALRFIAQPGKTRATPPAIGAVRDGAQPGDVLPHDRFLGPTPNPEVIIIGRAAGQRVAVLFSQQDFPKVQFGHRFELHNPGGGREAVTWLIAQIQAGALHGPWKTIHVATPTRSLGLHGGRQAASQNLSTSAPGSRPLSPRDGSQQEVPGRASSQNRSMSKPAKSLTTAAGPDSTCPPFRRSATEPNRETRCHHSSPAHSSTTLPIPK